MAIKWSLFLCKTAMESGMLKGMMEKMEGVELWHIYVEARRVQNAILLEIEKRVDKNG
jgi:hypothetical protein